MLFFFSIVPIAWAWPAIEEKEWNSGETVRLRTPGPRSEKDQQTVAERKCDEDPESQREAKVDMGTASRRVEEQTEQKREEEEGRKMLEVPDGDGGAAAREGGRRNSDGKRQRAPR